MTEVGFKEEPEDQKPESLLLCLTCKSGVDIRTPDLQVGHNSNVDDIEDTEA